MSAQHDTAITFGAVGRCAGLVLLLVFAAANMGTVDVNVIVLSVQVPVALIVAMSVAAGALASLRWSTARRNAERGRRDRRRETDRLLGRTPSFPVRH